MREGLKSRLYSGHFFGFGVDGELVVLTTSLGDTVVIDSSRCIPALDFPDVQALWVVK